MTDKIYIKWEEFHQDVKNLCKKIQATKKIDKIVAISRGGLLPAGIIAYETDIRNCHSINIATYVGNEHKELDKFDNLEDVGEVNENTLVIDDLSDSGQTFRLLRKVYPNACFATIYAKEKSLNEVDLYSRVLPDKWIVFPWDLIG